MAGFELELPEDVLRDLQHLSEKAEDITGGMVKAGAEVVASQVKSSVPVSDLAKHVKLSVVYRTPSDGGVNCKVYFSGYLPFSNGRTSFTRSASGKSYMTDKGVPAAFVANLFEYGTSERSTAKGADRGKMRKKPFFRKAFKKDLIERAMKEAQKRLSGGVIDE